MSKTKARRGLALRTVTAALGIALLAYLIHRVGMGTLIQSVSMLGWACC